MTHSIYESNAEKWIGDQLEYFILNEMLDAT